MIKMKKSLLLLSPVLMALFLAAPVQAGDYAAVASDGKNVVQPAPVVYGAGFYGAIQMGANVYQNRGDTRVFANDFGDTLTIEPNNGVGFFGGIKAGYVFGTGVFRPVVEGDFFYNGFEGGANTTLRQGGVVVRNTDFTSNINSGAFMGNFLMKFAFGKFQPYFGGGLGVYYADSAGVTINGNRGTFNGGGGASHTDFAWQIIAGADYYFTPKFSTFLEYKYLVYTSSQIETNQSRDLQQSLIGAGLRFHF
jgi:opacity protein-like surface antigen